MSASVWFEQVNTGFLEELRKTLCITNSKGLSIPLPKPELAFTVRKPEEDFKFEVYPCVTIYNLNSRYVPIRHLPLDYDFPVERDDEHHTVVLEKQAVPFDLEYQLDFWARYQSDMDSMTCSWLMNHYRQFNLDVVDDGGTPRSINVLQVGELVKSDLVLNKERLFHSIIKYSMWVEIDGEIRYTKPTVGSVTGTANGILINANPNL